MKFKNNIFAAYIKPGMVVLLAGYTSFVIIQDTGGFYSGLHGGNGYHIAVVMEILLFITAHFQVHENRTAYAGGGLIDWVLYHLGGNFWIRALMVFLFLVSVGA